MKIYAILALNHFGKLSRLIFFVEKFCRCEDVYIIRHRMQGKSYDNEHDQDLLNLIFINIR